MKLSQPLVGMVNKSCMFILIHHKLCLLKKTPNKETPNQNQLMPKNIFKNNLHFS